MITAWTKHLKDPEEKVQFEKSLRNSKWILDRQEDLLKEMQADVDLYETTIKQYDNPNWSFKQADLNGFKRCLKAIRKLINLDLKDKNDR